MAVNHVAHGVVRQLQMCRGHASGVVTLQECNNCLTIVEIDLGLRIDKHKVPLFLSGLPFFGHVNVDRIILCVTFTSQLDSLVEARRCAPTKRRTSIRAKQARQSDILGQLVLDKANLPPVPRKKTALCLTRPVFYI